MSQALPSETIEYERHVDGPRKSNGELLNVCETLAEDCRMALNGEWDRGDDGFADSLALLEGVIRSAKEHATPGKEAPTAASLHKNRFTFVTLDTTARHLNAAYNAFDSAAKKLGVNAVGLAERMKEGGIAELVATLELAEHALGNAVKPDCWRDF